MVAPVLHYIYDPLCGWCYAAAPLVAAARAVVTVRAHGGGMMAGPNRQAVTPQLHAYVMPHDQRIAQLSGQPFGNAADRDLGHRRAAVSADAPIRQICSGQGRAHQDQIVHGGYHDGVGHALLRRAAHEIVGLERR